MFTVCSKCNLRLTVTATDLRAAQGYVRCGRCANVFNALATLADDPARQVEPAATADTQRRPVLTQPEPHRTEPLPPPPAPPPPPPPPPSPTASESPSPSPSLPKTTLLDTSVTDSALEFNPSSTNISEVFIEPSAAERTGTFESIVLSSDELSPESLTLDPVIAPQALSAPALAVATEEGAAVDLQRMRDALAEPALTRTAPVPEPAAAIDYGDEVAPEVALLNPARAQVPDWTLHVGAWVLASCLILQVAHHYRAELADNAALHEPVTAFYQALGHPLAVHWNMADYDVRQLGASADGAAAGNLVVRAVISNRAPHEQPLPLLRVVMQDRFGNRVAARDLKPAEYLAAGAAQANGLAPGQRVDVQVAFQDPGQAVTGFEVDACMPGADHTVSCANDPGSH